MGRERQPRGGWQAQSSENMAVCVLSLGSQVDVELRSFQVNDGGFDFLHHGSNEKSEGVSDFVTYLFHSWVNPSLINSGMM